SSRSTRNKTQRLALFTHDRPGSGQHFALLIPPETADQARDALIAHGFPEETMQQDDGFPFICAILMGTRSNCMPSAQITPLAATKRANVVQSLKFLKFVATPKSRLPTNGITACRSSFFFPV